MKNTFLTMLLILATATCCAGSGPSLAISSNTAADVNGRQIEWGGDKGIGAPAGFNFAVLNGQFQSNGIKPEEMTIVVTSDERKCSAGSSAVVIEGTYSYQGREGFFAKELSEAHTVGIEGVRAVGAVRTRCNQTAAKAVVQGVLADLRDSQGE